MSVSDPNVAQLDCLELEIRLRKHWICSQGPCCCSRALVLCLDSSLLGLLRTVTSIGPWLPLLAPCSLGRLA